MIKGWFGRISGLDRLARAFGSDREPTGPAFFKQNVQIGKVRYRRCVTVHIGAEGLFLQIRFLFSRHRPPFFIPWSEIRKAKDTSLYAEKAAVLEVGSPPAGEIILPESLYGLAAPHLSRDSA